MDIDRFMTRLNPVVVRLLESRLHGLLSRGLMVIHIEGIRTGKRYRIPVGYQRQEDQLLILVSKSRRKNWWRNFKSERRVAITVRGKPESGLASLVDKESELFRRCVNATFDRLPGLAGQFGIARIGEDGLTDDEWTVVKAEAQVLVINL